MGAGRWGELWGDVARCLELSEEGPKKGCKGGMREEGRKGGEGDDDGGAEGGGGFKAVR